jgi:hypothetical protein
MQWYYSREGQRLGPVEEAELFRLAAEGGLEPDDYVWNPAMGDEWALASSVEGLFGAAGAAAAGPSPSAEPLPAEPLPAAGPGRVSVSCTAAVRPALERMKDILFRPFDLGRWFVLGVSAWLATLGEGGGSSFPSFNTGDLGGGGKGGTGSAPQSFEQVMESVRAFFNQHGQMVLAVGVLALILGLAFGLLMLWLRSRGKFMLLDNVVCNRAEIGLPWRAFAQHGHSLFLWYVGYSLVCLLVFALLAALAFFGILLPCIKARMFVEGVIPTIVVLGLVWLLVAVVLGYVMRFMEDFVIPLMYRSDLTATEAWRHFMPIFRANTGAFIVYGLFYLLLGMLAGLCVLAFALVTCCIGGCLMAIPYVGAVVLLPVTVFFRAYSLEFLAQFGAAYRLRPA